VRDVETPPSAAAHRGGQPAADHAEAKILEGGGVLVATATRDEDKNRALARKGAEIVVCPTGAQGDLLDLAKFLAGRASTKCWWKPAST